MSHPIPYPVPCLLLAATLGALGSTGVVSQHGSKAQGHPCVTAIHGHHSYLLFGWTLGEPCLAQQWLWIRKGREEKQWARNPLGSWTRHKDTSAR